MTTTTAAMRSVAASSTENWPALAAPAMAAPSPTVLVVLPLNCTNSETMLAFHAPPLAVSSPVTR